VGRRTQLSLESKTNNMNTEAKQQINRILVNALSILEDAQADLELSYKDGNVTDYYAALQRYELAGRGCSQLAAALDSIVAQGEELKVSK
jgi:hypothetical protein